MRTWVESGGQGGPSQSLGFPVLPQDRILTMVVKASEPLCPQRSLGRASASLASFLYSGARWLLGSTHPLAASETLCNLENVTLFPPL